MSEYKQRQVTINAHQRVRAITFITARGENPKAVFQEQEVLVDGDTVIERDVSYCETELTPPGKNIALRNPATGALTGQLITYAQLYAALYSLYREVAEARDAASGGDV